MHAIDLRSDTVTHPTAAMRQAMARAVVGDDVFGEDPTVNELEEKMARRLGKEAGLLVASGTMGNLVALLAHCGRGDEAILGSQCHTFIYEQGGISALGGVHVMPLANRDDGTLDLEEVEAAVRPDDVHFPRSRVLALENTHNRCGGRVLDASYMNAAGQLARRLGLKLHVDGARLFHASVALEIDPAKLAADADSVTVCLSKGLAAPVGSVVCGDGDFVARAKRMRKVVGGGMRQAGILAAAGLVALEEMVDRLREDHFNARKLARGLASIPGLSLDPEKVETNIVFFELEGRAPSPQELVRRLEARGVRVLALGARRLRAVTHYQVSEADVDRAAEAFRDALR